MGSGIVCRVWNVKADKKKGCRSQLSDSIGYILDDEKTEAKLAGETAEQFNKKQLERECRYIENDIKTVGGAYVAVQNLASSDVSGAVREMMDVKNFYGKLNGRAALHGIISLSAEESGKEHAAGLMALCADVMKKIFPNHQAVFAVHTNTDNLHIHFIVNSVGLDGRKIHQPNNFIGEVLQPCINEYARQHGFTPNTEWSRQKQGVSDYVSLKMRLREAIDLAIESADSFDEFYDNLKNMGFRINCGKHISIKDAGMDKAMRTHRLGLDYSKESIVERIMTRKLAFEQIHISDAFRATMAQSGMLSKKEVFNPAFAGMKKYRDMPADERRRVAEQMKEGINPWRMRAAMNWQLKEIADELNMTARAGDYIRAYSDDGKAESALRGILERKKEVAGEKKALKQQMRRYKPVTDIYRKMKAIERMSYLYEHEGRREYRDEYEEYRELTRRLKNGYGKSVSDVAQLVDSYETQYRCLNSQLCELSKEYRELKKYAEMRGTSTAQGMPARESEKEDVSRKELSAAMARSESHAERRHIKEKAAYSFTQAVNLLSAGGKKGTHAIADAEDPSCMAIVFSDEDGIRLAILDLKGDLREEIEIPSLKNRSQAGYGTLKEAKQKYGFSDAMYAFDNVDDARRHLAEEKAKNTREISPVP